MVGVRLRKGPLMKRPFLLVLWLAQQPRQLGDIRRDRYSPQSTWIV
jgi:hypothetical protein